MKFIPLVQVCDFQGGSQPPKEQWIDHEEDGYIRMLQIRDFTQPDKENIEYVRVSKAIKTCNNDDILIARYGASVGKILTGLCGAYNVAIVKTIPDTNKLSKRFLYHYLNSPYFQNYILSVGSRAAQAGFNKDDLCDAQIPDLSLEDQANVVYRLDRVNNLIALRKEQLAKLDELVKAHFTELFGSPVSNPKGWETEKMREVAPAESYSGSFDETVWLLNLDMVESQTGRVIDYLYVSKNEVGSSTCTFDTSNVLYSKLRPYLNKVVIPDRCGYATSEMIPLKPNPAKINRAYLTFMLRSDEFVNTINDKVAGAKMPRVSMSDFRDFNVPIPPMELQNQFTAFVEQTNKTKLTIQASLDKLEVMKKALMQEYFG